MPGRAAAQAQNSSSQQALQKGNEAYDRKDYAEARSWLSNAADQGDAFAQNKLGTLYENGLGGPQDEKEAARLYRLAADQGNGSAQSNLASLYAEGGGGLPKNDREAARLFKLAADQGIAGAQYNLGTFYEGGVGGLPKNDSEAARLYRLAADQGLAVAQYNLGNFYMNGRGVTRNDEEAARFLKLAADQGYKDAQRNLDILAKRKATTQLTANDHAAGSTDAAAAFQFLQGQMNIDVSLTGRAEPGLSRIQATGGDMCKLRCGFHYAVGMEDVADVEFEFAMTEVASNTLQWEIDGHNRANFHFSSADGTSVFRKRARSRKVDVISFEQKALSDWTKWSEWAKADKVYCRSKPDKGNLARVIKAFSLIATSCGAREKPF
jgi:TPR repeat protein